MTFEEWFAYEFQGKTTNGLSKAESGMVHSMKLICERSFHAGYAQNEQKLSATSKRLNKIHKVANDQSRPLLDRIKDIRELSVSECGILPR